MLIDAALSSSPSNPEDQTSSNEAGLGFLYLLLFCLKKAAGMLRGARCHILGLPH